MSRLHRARAAFHRRSSDGSPEPRHAPAASGRPRSSPAAHQRDDAGSASESLQPLAEREREPGRPAIVDLGDEPAGADVPFVQPLDLSEKGVGSQGLLIETVCEVVVGDLTMAGPSRVGDRAPSMQEIGRPDECVTLGNREKSPFEF